MKPFMFAVLFSLLLTGLAKSQPRGQQLIEKWRIDTETAGRMLLDQQNCTSCRFEKWQNEDSVKKRKHALRESLGISSLNFRKNWMKGRYSSKDVSRYALNHGLSKESAEAQVAGYTTRILRFKLPKKDREKYNIWSPPPHSFWFLPKGFLISAPALFILPIYKKPNVNSGEEKYIYFDFGRICPPPHPC